MLIEEQNGNFAKPVLGVVLSLFDGMSCGQIALQRAGIKVENYFAAEIDKYAIQVTKHNYPDTIQLGDVTKVKAKLLCLSEVYSYICNYDSNLQSNISEWEVLYWLNKNFTFSAKIRTQKPNERQEVSESSIIQRIEEVWFSNREMGSVRKFGDDTRSGSNGKENDIRTPQQLQCSEWRYDNDIYRRYKEENIGIAIRETKNGDSEKKNFGNIEEMVFKGRESENYFGENKKSNVEEGCSGELLEREGEDRFSRTVKKEKRNGRAENNSFIDEIVRELCGWNETDGIAQDYWNILRLHKEEQVTVVEYDGGYHIFKGKIDLLCGGSPCQGFSFAGKQLNFDDPRSKLFFEFVRLLNECKPKYFLLENVKMKKEYQDVITEHLGVEPIEINSNLLSAQNRKRIYWTNIPGVTIPNDKGILLKDIVHENNDEVLNVELPNFNVNPSGKGMNGDVYSIEKSKSRTLTTNKGEGQKISVAIAEFIVPFDKTLQILDKEVQRGKVGYFRKDSQANRVYYIHDKAITLTGEAGGGAAKMGQYLFGCITPDRIEKRQNGQRFNDGKKFYTLTAQDKHGVLIEGYIRKLTPIECERLQTVPDNYTAIVSNSQRYKMLGNGWTVDVIAHIFGGLS